MTIAYQYASTGRVYSPPMFIIYSAIFSLINVVIAGLFIYCYYDVDLLKIVCEHINDINNKSFSDIKLENNLTVEKILIIVYSTSIPVGVPVIAIINSFIRSQYVNCFLMKLHVTTRMGTPVWDCFLYDNDLVLIKDFSSGIAYYGIVRYFSEDDKPKEVYLRKVSVKDINTLKTIYEVEGAFISLEGKQYSIESQKITLENKANRNLESNYRKWMKTSHKKFSTLEVTSPVKRNK